MPHALKSLDSWTKELSVELGTEELKTYIAQTEQDFAGQITVDGFRKGKVPLDTAKTRLDQKQVLEQALSRALELSLSQAITEQDLDVYKVTDLAIQKNTAEALKYNIKLHVYPTFTLPDLKEIKVAHKDVVVENKEVEETLETVRNSRASFHDKDTIAAQGDRVEVDFDITVDNKPLEGGQSKNHPLIIGGKSFIPGFEDQLVGMNKNEEKQFTLQAPNEYFHKDVAGKKLDIKVKLNKIQSVSLPTLDDDFAKSIGSFKDVAELKNNIRDGLNQEKKSKEQQRARLEVLDAVIKKTNIEISPELEKDQLNTMIANFDTDLHRRGLELNMYLAQLGKTEEDLRKEWKIEAQRQVKLILALHKIAREHNITVMPEEVDQASGELIQTLVGRGEASLEQIDMNAVRRNVQDRLLNDKTLEFIERTCIQ